MGNSFSASCVSCIARDQDEKPITASDLEESEDNSKWESPRASSASDGKLKTCDQSKASVAPDNALKAQINAIVKARAAGIPKQPAAPSSVDNELQAQINAMLKSRAENRNQSQAACSSGGGEVQAHIEWYAVENAYTDWEPREQFVNTYAEPCWEDVYQQSPVRSVACSHDSGLQDQINAIVGAHSSSLNQQRLSLDLASPSPAKSVSEIEWVANLALSQAKERNTPATAPATLHHLDWVSYEQDVAPCKLSFADCGDALDVPSTSLAEIDSTASCVTQPQEKTVDTPKVQTCPFNVNDIPSPTRSRAKKQQLSWADVEVEETAVSESEQKIAEREPEQTAAEAEAAAAKLKAMQAKWLRDFEEKAAMTSMDKTCVETFLESVKKCAWRERVRTPIKGSNLYTKHIRPCRPAGTSVDVKDSSFRNLGSFMQFLESEGLLRLRPGLSDPMVTEIHFDACRKYKYDSRQQELFLNVIREEAPHDSGCSCRLCLPCTAGSTWQ